MEIGGIDAVAVVAAAVAGFGFGALWYMALAKPWMAALGKAEADARPTPALFAVTFAGQLVMAAVLAAAIAATGAEGAAGGVAVGALAWLGFAATTMVINHGYQGQDRALTLIDGGHWLGVLALQGAVIGLIG